jgi:WD repeat-containing protein 49
MNFIIVQVLKVWDIKEQTCLQSVFIKFPISGGLIGRLPEFGPFSLQVHTATKTVLVTANDYIGMLKFGRASTYNVNHVTTHASQLSGVVYNSKLKQVS